MAWVSSQTKPGSTAPPKEVIPVLTGFSPTASPWPFPTLPDHDQREETLTPSSNEYIVKTSNVTRLAWLSVLAVATLVAALFAGGGAAQASGVGSPDTECQRAFGPGYVGFKVEEDESSLNGTYKDESGLKITISNVNKTLHTFDYTSTKPVNVIVKGGPDQGTLYPSSDKGTGLHAPFNTSSN